MSIPPDAEPRGYSAHPPDDAVTARIRREEDRREIMQQRRYQDRIDSWLKVIVPAVLAGSVAWIFNIHATQSKNDVILQQMGGVMASIEMDIKKMQEMRTVVFGIEKEIENIKSRSDGQMDGLIAGNRSIHEVLQRMIDLSSEFSALDKKMDVIEQRSKDESRKK